MQAKAKKRGVNRMVELGYQRIVVWFDQEDFARLNAACEREAERRAKFIRKAVADRVKALGIHHAPPAAKTGSKAKRKGNARAKR